MGRPIKVFIILSFWLSSFALAEVEAVTSLAEKWQETDFSFDYFKQNKSFSKDMCYSDLQHLWACMAALNQLASNATPAMAVGPLALQNKNSEVFYANKLFAVVAPERDDLSQSLKVTLIKRSLKLKRLRSELQRDLLVSVQQRTDFELLLQWLEKKVVRSSTKRSSLLAGQVFNFYQSYAVDPYGHLEPLSVIQDLIHAPGNSSFVGIGVRSEQIFQRDVIQYVIKGGGASEAGLRAHDIIARIDGKNVLGLDSDRLTLLLRGPVGSKVQLGVIRGKHKLSFTVTRKKVTFANVEADVVSNDSAGTIGYLRVSDFVPERVCLDARAAIESVLSQKKPSAWILDLRNNSGGDPTNAACVAGLFVGQQLIYTRDEILWNGRKHESPHWAEVDQIIEAPLVVLVNAVTASAAELVAGALQDLKRGTIVGERTYGKGSVQSSTAFDGFPMLENFKTTAHYRLPLGRYNDHIGITPSLEVPTVAGDDEFVSVRDVDLNPALMATQDVFNPLPAERLDPSSESCVGYPSLLKAELSKKTPSPDFQVEVAKRLASCLSAKKSSP